jgi:hypothetical protein
LNSISDKYLPLITFLGVSHPGLENIDKFSLESTSPDSFFKSIYGSQASLVEDPTHNIQYIQSFDCLVF